MAEAIVFKFRTQVGYNNCLRITKYAVMGVAIIFFCCKIDKHNLLRVR